MSEDERPRKSWKEIDRQRDKSRHRQEERPQPGAQRRGPKNQASYRAALDRLFESGKIGELVQQRAPAGGSEPGEGKESRLKLLARIRDAPDREAVSREVDAYLESFELPDDLEILGRVLEHRSPVRQMEAMERIEALLSQQQPRRKGALLAQLRMIRDLADDPQMTELASRLIESLS